MYRIIRVMPGAARRAVLTAVPAAAALILTSTPLSATPDFPPPKEAQVQWVGKNIEVNGIHSDIRSFHTKKSPEKVAEFYREEWKEPVAKGMPGYTETDAMPPWHLITRLEDGYLMTVQYQEQDRGGTWGYLAMSPLPTKESWLEPGKGFPRMSDSTIVNETKSDDPGITGRTMLISNKYSISSNVEFYRSHYRSQGWTVESDKELSPGKMHALVFKTKRNRVTMMFIGENNETRIVVNAVEHSIL